jgi:hypothetical protein
MFFYSILPPGLLALCCRQRLHFSKVPKTGFSFLLGLTEGRRIADHWSHRLSRSPHLCDGSLPWTQLRKVFSPNPSGHSRIAGFAVRPRLSFSPSSAQGLNANPWSNSSYGLSTPIVTSNAISTPGFNGITRDRSRLRVRGSHRNSHVQPGFGCIRRRT